MQVLELNCWGFEIWTLRLKPALFPDFLLTSLVAIESMHVSLLENEPTSHLIYRLTKQFCDQFIVADTSRIQYRFPSLKSEANVEANSGGCMNKSAHKPLKKWPFLSPDLLPQ